jgi:hypothetical protein
LNNSGTTALEGDLAVASKLTLTKGKLDISTYDLVYASNSGGSSASYIFSSDSVSYGGTVTRTSAAKGYVYPLGTSSGYAGLTTTAPGQSATWTSSGWALASLSPFAFAFAPREREKAPGAGEELYGLLGNFSGLAFLQRKFAKHPVFQSSVDRLLDAFEARAAVS